MFILSYSKIVIVYVYSSQFLPDTSLVLRDLHHIWAKHWTKHTTTPLFSNPREIPPQQFYYLFYVYLFIINWLLAWLVEPDWQSPMVGSLVEQHTEGE